MDSSETTAGVTDLPGARLGVVRGISYGLFGKPDEFGPQARALGATLVRAYVFWGQVEPEPGQYVWDTVDALLDQLDGGEEVWITVCSSSPWATQQKTDFLPPSPANDPAAYAEFIRRLVAHCAGRVHYWQPDNEPSNIGLTWAGTAAEYVTQLAAMHAAVRAADPSAAVVLGGCGYDVLSSESGSPQRQFFDQLVSEGRDYFDLFSVHLYGEPRQIPAYVETVRQLMRAHGYEKPVVAGELGGPVLFEFPDVEAATQAVFMEAFADAPATQSLEELQARARQDTPERRAMATLYARMSSLPPQLQMFMADCPPELEALRHRINCRQLVTRTVLAFAAGIRRAAYWNLAPEVPGVHDPLQMMHLLFGKLPLLDYEDGSLEHRYPAASTFALLCEQLAGLTAVTRIELADQPLVYAYRVDRTGRDPLLVVWVDRDTFSGENEPDLDVDVAWDAKRAAAVDALGSVQEVDVRVGRLRLRACVTPLLVTT